MPFEFAPPSPQCSDMGVADRERGAGGRDAAWMYGWGWKARQESGKFGAIATQP